MTHLLVKTNEGEKSLELAKEYYRFQIEHGGYTSSTPIEERRDYRRLKERFEKHNKLKIDQRVNHTITEVCGRELTRAFEEYGNEDNIVKNEKGFKQIIKVLEEGRERLRSDGMLHDSTDLTIRRCINLTKFAEKKGFGVVLSS